MWDAAVFDYDGCLVDSMGIVYRRVINVFREAGKTPPTKDEFDRTFFNPWLDYYAANGILASPAQILQWSSAGADFGFCPVFPDAHVLLKHLHRRILMAIISGAPAEPIKENLAANGAAHYFQYIMGDCVAKTAPIISFIHATGLSPDKVVVIGDMTSDILDGKQAGVCTIGIARSQASYEALVVAQADLIVSSLEELVILWS